MKVVNKQIQIHTWSDNVFKGNTHNNNDIKIHTDNFEVNVYYYNNTRFLYYI